VLRVPAGRGVPLITARRPWSGLLEGEELAHLSTEPAAAAIVRALPDDLHPAVAGALADLGVASLYVHQAAAWDLARSGGHLIVTTGTASGKSLAFNLPIAHAIAADPVARALYLYPTKALARDQARALAALGLGALRPAIYDGDTPPERRAHVRREANAVLSNPDMLHVGILPHHDRWGEFLHNLRFVVVDEAHVYRGVFGSHVANVLRRLQRLAASYGADPQFLLASATIANAAELASALTGLAVTAVADDGAPRPEREVALWNPPLLDPALGTRASALGEAARLLAALTSRGLRTICFAKSRKAAELIHRFAVERVDGDTAARLTPYRAGYTAPQRREIERRLVQGELLGVTATDALELGIDVGSLDCAISAGFPGTVASLRQQWGRAGRRHAGLAVLVASDDALDQYFMREPEALLSRRVEAARIDHENHRILDPHVRAAAYEGPITDRDAACLGETALVRAAALPELDATPAGWVWTGREAPAARTSLRSGDQEAFTIVEEESGAVLGTIERERAYSTVHAGAVYLHLGQQHVVRDLDLVARAALVTRQDVDWYTQAKKESATSIDATVMTRHSAGVDLHFGRVSVTEQVVAYQRKSAADGATLETVPLVMPEVTFDTEAIWFSPETELLDGLDQMPRLLGSLHAAEHALIALLPLWAMCDRWDIGGLSTNAHPQTGRPTVFVYDGHAGGVGIAERGFECFEGWVADTARLVLGCPCADGCPSCVQSPKCGNLNDMLDKRAAATLLERMAESAPAKGGTMQAVDLASARSST
jgi:DEAD/DEAH box helicase domain-containing protein